MIEFNTVPLMHAKISEKTNTTDSINPIKNNYVTVNNLDTANDNSMRPSGKYVLALNLAP
jgi:hypothetical protein